MISIRNNKKDISLKAHNSYKFLIKCHRVYCNSSNNLMLFLYCRVRSNLLHTNNIILNHLLLITIILQKVKCNNPLIKTIDINQTIIMTHFIKDQLHKLRLLINLNHNSILCLNSSHNIILSIIAFKYLKIKNNLKIFSNSNNKIN